MAEPNEIAPGDEVENLAPEIVATPELLDERIEQIVMERYSGQFPHPEHMERYAKLYPRAPEIIFEQFEKQGAHRREIEKVYVNGNERRSNIGQWLAYSLVVLAIGVGLVAIWFDQGAAGSAVIIAAFGGGIVLYIAGGSAKSQSPAREVKKNERDRVGARTGSVQNHGPTATNNHERPSSTQ